MIDLLGHGRSDPPDAGDDLSIRGHAAPVDGLLRRAAGHEPRSPGTRRVQRSHSHSQQHHRTIDGLCLVSPSDSQQCRPWRERLLCRLRPLALHLPAEVLARFVGTSQLAGYAVSDRGQHSVDQYMRPYATAAGRHALLQQLCARVAGDSGASRRTTTPVSLVWGSDDPFVSQSAVEQLHSSIPGSTLAVVEGGRHFLPEEAAERVVTALGELMSGTSDASAAGMIRNLKGVT